MNNWSDYDELQKTALGTRKKCNSQVFDEVTVEIKIIYAETKKTRRKDARVSNRPIYHWITASKTTGNEIYET